MEIREAVTSDAEELTRLHLEVWEAAYGELMPAEVFAERRAGAAERVARWRRIVVESPATTSVAADGDRLLGFVSVGPARNDDCADLTELWALYVDHRAWRSGVGTALLAATLGDVPAYLWVLDGNNRAIEFYRRHGFELDGTVEEEPDGRHVRMTRGRALRAPG